MSSGPSIEIGNRHALGSVDSASHKSSQEALDSRPRYLNHEEVLASAMRDFGIDPESGYQGAIQAASLESFIKDKVTGVRVNGVDVLSIDFEHSDEALDPYIERFIGLDRTRMIVAEYFYPEIEFNINASPARGYAQDSLEVKTNPGRIRFAKEIAEIAQRQVKPVAVADIANKPSYIAVREAFTASLIAAGFVSLDPALLFSGLAWEAFILSQVNLDNGIFDKNKIHKFEKLVLNFEQARRMYLARGVEQLTEEYPPTLESPNPQIVVVYPKAHGIRMADALVNPEGSLETVKSAVYKIFGATLDFAVRTYAWRDSLQRLKESGYKWGQFAPVEDEGLVSHFANEDQGESTSGWRLVSKRGI